ncbi:MAG: hypothetical protein HYZ65_09340 [Burkholderiales bacterium]|nr:hypothetical protein [Burkholderiales bacterium]
MTKDTDRRIAVQAEILYLSNLLLLPGLAFAALLWLAHRHKNSGAALALCHLRQTIYASLWAGILLLLVALAIIYLGGFRSPYTWMVLLLYFICCHSMLILFGVAGLARAMAGLCYVYPLPGSKRWQ